MRLLLSRRHLVEELVPVFHQYGARCKCDCQRACATHMCFSYTAERFDEKCTCRLRCHVLVLRSQYSCSEVHIATHPLWSQRSCRTTTFTVAGRTGDVIHVWSKIDERIQYSSTTSDLLAATTYGSGTTYRQQLRSRIWHLDNDNSCWVALPWTSSAVTEGRRDRGSCPALQRRQEVVA